VGATPVVVTGIVEGAEVAPKNPSFVVFAGRGGLVTSPAVPDEGLGAHAIVDTATAIHRTCQRWCLEPSTVLEVIALGRPSLVNRVNLVCHISDHLWKIR